MIILMYLTAIAAILGAIVSAFRTYTKFQFVSSVQDAIAPQTNQSRLAPDLDLDRSIAIPPMLPQPQVEIPLATSLKILDVIEPDTSIEPESHEHHEVQPILEVEQLEQFEETMKTMAARALDSDRFVRLAVAVELGELASSGHGVDRITRLLNQLMEDADLEVRVQAGASLAMLPNPVV